MGCGFTRQQGECHELLALQNGLNFNSDQESISKGMAIASQVNATDINAAIQLIGLSTDAITI